jgi:hypothetical protein
MGVMPTKEMEDKPFPHLHFFSRRRGRVEGKRVILLTAPGFLVSDTLLFTGFNE